MKKMNVWIACLLAGWISEAVGAQVYVEDGKTMELMEVNLCPMVSLTDKILENLERICPWDVQFPFKEGAREALEDPVAYKWKTIGRLGEWTIWKGWNPGALFTTLVTEDSAGRFSLLYVCFDDGRGIYEEGYSVQGDRLRYSHYYSGTGRYWMCFSWVLGDEGRLVFSNSRGGSGRYGEDGEKP